MRYFYCISSPELLCLICKVRNNKSTFTHIYCTVMCAFYLAPIPIMTHRLLHLGTVPD